MSESSESSEPSESTRQLPTVTRAWCRALLTRRFRPSDIQAKFHTLAQQARASFPASGCFSLEWLSEVLVQIDKLWYDGLLLPGVYQAYGAMDLYLDNSETRVAGYVKETGDKKKLSLHMNRELFATLFQSQEQGYHSGGLLCRDRMVCALNVILHETVHLALTLCDKLGHRPDVRDHGKEFNRMVKNMFGHTDSQHGLIPGYEQRHDLQTIRQRLKAGMRVEVFVDGRWQPCRVARKGYKWTHVVTDTAQKLTVHAGLLRLPPE